MLVCLKMLVIFLICGDEYVKVAHFVPLLKGVGVGDLGTELFRCILSLNRVSRVRGTSLLCARVICVAIPYLVVLCQAGVRAFF